jgi:hypothetical protein
MTTENMVSNKDLMRTGKASCLVGNNTGGNIA